MSSPQCHGPTLAPLGPTPSFLEDAGPICTQGSCQLCLIIERMASLGNTQLHCGKWMADNSRGDAGFR